MDKKLYKDAIRKLDPDKEIVKELDIDNGIITFNKKIEKDRPPKYENEAFCRAFIICWLCKKGGYKLENIYIEKRYSIGRPGGTSAYTDILVRRDNTEKSTPFMVIEVKTPKDYDPDDLETIHEQLFKVARHETGVSVLSLSTVKVRSGGLEIVSMNIDYNRHPDFKNWVDDNKPTSSELPKHFGKIIKTPLKKNGKKDLRDDITLDEFDIIWDKLHKLLWGGHIDDNVIFKWVVYLLLAKIYDEKNVKSGEEYSFQLKYIAGEIESNSELYERINKLYKKAMERYLKKSNNEINDLGDGDFKESNVRNVVEQLQEISITKSSKNHSGDLLGRFFERIIKEGFQQSTATFFTHPNIVHFMLDAVGLKQLAKEKISQNVNMDERVPYIIDPSCGSGTFLLGAFRMIENYIKENKKALSVNEDVRENIDALFGSGTSWAHTHIYGLDPHRSLPIAAKVNMILHGDGSGHIFQESALGSLKKYSEIDDQRRLDPTEDKSDSNYSFPVSEGFDLIITNPPFSITLSTEDKRSLDNTFSFANNTTSENLFVERWYQLLKPKGRLAAVLPESFFNVSENDYIRHFLFKYFKIKAIVSLPAVAFEPHTTTLTSLLFAQKKNMDEIEDWIKTSEKHEKILNKEVNQLRKLLYKKNWPKTSNDQQEWLNKIINKASKYLSENEKISIKKMNDFEKKVNRLRYKLNRAKKEDKNQFLIKEICKEQNYKFPIISVENVGYKRTKRSTRIKQNDLFMAKNDPGDEGKVIENIESIENSFYLEYNLKNPEKAIDVIKEVVKWE
ncbi:MAG: HsdM family class I SAM-dependent methyltransferase [Bacillota bacterium]